jgi:ATP-dependent exoDNAse (exonuclease V) beta subunit
VRGLRALARDMRLNWEDAVRQVEGRPDAEQQAVALITIHAAKGLEWPIVIPINMTGIARGESGIACDRRLAQFSTLVLGAEPSAYAHLKTWNEQEQVRERVRLWYVASTRARDLLILPRHSASLSEKSWARVVDLDLAALPAFDCQQGLDTTAAPDALANLQSHAVFVAEAERIALATPKLTWVRPSRDEGDTAELATDALIFSVQDAVDEVPAIPVVDVVGSSTRGTILHKLIEEVLTGEAADDGVSLTARATELLAELDTGPAAENRLSIVPAELAATILRTLNLPEIAQLRPRLLPECRVYGRETSANGEILTSGTADAVALSTDSTIDVVIDWKSDVELDAGKLNAYRGQLEAYRKATGAPRALLVLMTSGKVIELGA